MKKILTVIDMQNDFVQPKGKLSIKDANKLVKPMNKFLAENRFDKVIATMDTHSPVEYKNSAEGAMFPIHCVYGTHGWSLSVDIKQPYTTIKKDVFNVWEKNAPSLFRELDCTSNEIYVIGIAADYCVKDAVAGLLQNGFNTTIITDLTKGIGSEIGVVADENFAKYLQTKQLRMITSKEFQGGR